MTDVDGLFKVKIDEQAAIDWLEEVVLRTEIEGEETENDNCDQ